MDVITLGESMVLFTPEESGPLRHVSGFRKTIGGAESNVAIALARLGHQVGWISKLGKDEFGLYVRNFIRGEGVDTSKVLFNQQMPTAVFFKERRAHSDPSMYYYRKGSAFTTIRHGEVDKAYFSRANYIHLTGITPALSELSKETIFEALKWAKQNKQTVVFDPNIRLKLWSPLEAKKVLLEIVSQCQVVMPGLEEGELMTGETTPEKIAGKILDMGSQLVVVKLGDQGAYYATKTDSAYVPSYEVKPVDTAGAGDGFAAGILSGLIRGWDLYDTVKLGNRIGAYALGVIGDVEGYPYWDEVNPNGKYKQTLR